MSGPSPKKPVSAVAKPPVPKVAPATGAKRPVVSAAATVGAPATAPNKLQAIASDKTPAKPVAASVDASTAHTDEAEEEETKEPTEAHKAVVQEATTTAPASSKEHGKAVPPSKAAITAKATAADRRRKLMRQMELRTKLIIEKNPAAIVPPYMFIAMTKIHLLKLRESPIYFANINTNVYEKDNPKSGDIIYQQSESSLAGTVDVSMHLINARLKEGDPGHGAHFLQVQGPPMVISNVTDPLGTWRNKNAKLIANTENKAFPDQHMHMWSHISRCYFIATGSRLKLIDAECEAFERWLFTAQMNYWLVLIDSDNLKRTLKPAKFANGKSFHRTMEFYQAVLPAFEKVFRLVKFDKFVKEQKALASGESTNDEKAVRDVERSSGGDALRVNLHDEVFKAGGLASLESDDEDDDDDDADDVAMASDGVGKKKAAAAKKTKGPVAPLEYMAEKFTAATDIELTKEQVDEYAAMEKLNENILNIMSNKLYIALVEAIPGYDRTKDTYRKDLNVGKDAKPVAIPVKLFPHPDAPMAPKGMWPYRADTVEPYIATGSLSSKAQVWNYGKKRVLAKPSEAAKWAKEIVKLYKQSEITKKVPVLERLYTARNIVLKSFNTYCGFKTDPFDLLEIHHREGDVEAHVFALRATLNAPVDVGGGDKVIYSNMKLDSLSSRTTLRAPESRISEMTGRGRVQVGKIDYSGASHLLTRKNLGDPTSSEVAQTAASQKMVIVQDDDAETNAASADWSQDTRDMMRDLKIDDETWVMSLPNFAGENAKSLVPALKAQCGLTEKSPGLYELLPGEAERLYESMTQAAQSQVAEGAAKTGDHLQANLQASRQLTDAGAVRKQIMAAAHGKSAAASFVPKTAPTFSANGDDDEPVDPDDMIDAGAEYAD